MFIGEYKAAKTAGNRVAIPKKIRAQLKNKDVIITRGYEGCIVLVERSDFETLLEGVSSVPFISGDKRETARFLLSGAHEVVPDSQGRIILPESLIEHADINGEEVIFIGVGSWVEIWDQKKWNEYKNALDAQSKDIANKLLELNKGVNT